MSRLGVFKTSMFSSLLVLGTLVACHSHASDRAVIEVSGESEVMWFRSDAVLFTDRNNRLAECPAGLAGERFLRSSIDQHAPVVGNNEPVTTRRREESRASTLSTRIRMRPGLRNRLCSKGARCSSRQDSRPCRSRRGRHRLHDNRLHVRCLAASVIAGDQEG